MCTPHLTSRAPNTLISSPLPSDLSLQFFVSFLIRSQIAKVKQDESGQEETF